MSTSGLHKTTTHYSKSVDYSLDLMSRASDTPEDAGCQNWLMDKLRVLGFTCHQFEVNGVKNLVAELGSGEDVIAFAGHTDVLPAGPLEK